MKDFLLVSGLFVASLALVVLARADETGAICYKPDEQNTTHCYELPNWGKKACIEYPTETLCTTGTRYDIKQFPTSKEADKGAIKTELHHCYSTYHCEWEPITDTTGVCKSPEIDNPRLEQDKHKIVSNLITDEEHPCYIAATPAPPDSP